MTRKNRLKAKVLPYARHMDAVGDISRMSIVYMLAHGALDVRQMIDISGLPPSLMSHHLKKLHDTGWVSRTKYGKRVEYRLEGKAFFFLEKLFKDTPLGRELFS